MQSVGNGAGIYNRGTMSPAQHHDQGQSGPRPSGRHIAALLFRTNGGGIFTMRARQRSDFVSVIRNLRPTGDGGGMWNAGTLRVSNSLLARNQASGSGARLRRRALPLRPQPGQHLGCLPSSSAPRPAMCSVVTRANAALRRLPPTTVVAESSAARLSTPADPAMCPATDVWGTPRPVDGNADGSAACDIGAYELPAAPPGVLAAGRSRRSGAEVQQGSPHNPGRGGSTPWSEQASQRGGGRRRRGAVGCSQSSTVRRVRATAGTP